jgi:hypothetical protein
MGYDPRNYQPAQQRQRSVGSQLATSHRAGYAPPPPPAPVINQPAIVSADATTVAAQVESVQSNYWQFAWQHFANRTVGDETTAKLDNAAVAATELAKAATELGPQAIKEQVVDAAQARLDAAIAAKRIDGDPAQETRNSRFWEGKREVLKSKAGAEVVIEAQKMLESADGNELSVLYERLPDELAARGVDTSFILKTLALRPEIAGPADDLVAATKAYHIAQGNAVMLKRAVQSGHVPHTLISTQPFDRAAQ